MIGSSALKRVVSEKRGRPSSPATPVRAILSFDVEEHDRIEAASSLAIGEADRLHYRERVSASVGWLLDELAAAETKATFFIVGQIAREQPTLVRRIHDEGHEIASHSWAHQRLHRLDPASFREDVRKSVDALQQASGAAVHGYRAPTFSVMRETAWAIDELAELGLTYDSSIYPVRHDRYGVPDAPRGPFMVQSRHHALLELPPATLRYWRANIPTGGGGYFRLLPSELIHRTIQQTAADCQPAVAMFYFHPWEFDPQQPRLPLGALNRWRTYFGIHRSQARLSDLLRRHHFSRAIDVVHELQEDAATLPRFNLRCKN